MSGRPRPSRPTGTSRVPDQARLDEQNDHVRALFAHALAHHALRPGILTWTERVGRITFTSVIDTGLPGEPVVTTRSGGTFPAHPATGCSETVAVQTTRTYRINSSRPQTEVTLESDQNGINSIDLQHPGDLAALHALAGAHLDALDRPERGTVNVTFTRLKTRTAAGVQTGLTSSPDSADLHFSRRLLNDRGPNLTRRLTVPAALIPNLLRATGPQDHAQPSDEDELLYRDLTALLRDMLNRGGQNVISVNLQQDHGSLLRFGADGSEHVALSERHRQDLADRRAAQLTHLRLTDPQDRTVTDVQPFGTGSRLLTGTPRAAAPHTMPLHPELGVLLARLTPAWIAGSLTVLHWLPPAPHDPLSFIPLGDGTHVVLERRARQVTQTGTDVTDHSSLIDLTRALPVLTASTRRYLQDILTGPARP